MKREEAKRRKGSIKGKRNFCFFCVEKSLIKKGKSPIKNSKNSLIKTGIFYCFEKVLIRHSSRKLYNVFSEEASHLIAQFPMVRKVDKK